MNPEPITLPLAVAKLLTWLKEKDLTPYRFALMHELDPSAINKLLNGKQGASLKLAFAIQEATDGAVPAADWSRS
jgi:hypothetical protein